MTSSCCTKRSRAAVPYSNLRGAIGTFHTGKSTDPSRKGVATWTLPAPGRNYAAKSARAKTARATSARAKSARAKSARQFLPPGDATQELVCQDRDAARYITSLPGIFLHQKGKLRRCSPHSRGTQKTGQARQFLPPGDATQELPYQD